MAYKTRKDIPEKYKWNIEAMYENTEAAEKDLKKCLSMAKAFGKYQGQLKKDAKTFCDALKAKDKLFEKAEKVAIYAHQKKDEDGRISSAIELDGKASAMIAQVSQALSFFAPEFAAIPEKTLRKFIKEYKPLKVYEFYIDEAIRHRKHVLKKSDEMLLAQISELTGCPEDVFRMLSDAEFKVFSKGKVQVCRVLIVSEVVVNNNF